MKRTERSNKPSPPPAPKQPKPIGPPVKVHKEQYLEIKVAIQAAQLAEQSLQQTATVAQRAFELSQQLHQQATSRVRSLLAKQNVPDGQYAFNDDKCTMQRMA
jgi:hypothetical protein